MSQTPVALSGYNYKHSCPAPAGAVCSSQRAWLILWPAMHREASSRFDFSVSFFSSLPARAPQGCFAGRPWRCVLDENYLKKETQLACSLISARCPVVWRWLRSKQISVLTLKLACEIGMCGISVQPAFCKLSASDLVIKHKNHAYRSSKVGHFYMYSCLMI